jgi:hypothetical protein
MKIIKPFISLENWRCPLDTFKCRNGPCLNLSLVCDEKIDCPGTWVDEDGCCKFVDLSYQWYTNERKELDSDMHKHFFIFSYLI